MPKISVIVPVYNGEKYLRECLDSLAAQTLHDIEIIAVDNGSADGSAAILAEYAAKDERVKVLTLRPNQGPSGARNAALDIAKGEYIAFCDCDDTVPGGAYEAIYGAAQKMDADLAVGNYVDISAKGVREPRDVCAIKEGYNCYLKGGALWNKIFRRAPLEREHIRFSSLRYGEDTLFLAEVLKSASGIARTPEAVYEYYHHADNASALTKHYTAAHVVEQAESKNRYFSILNSLGLPNLADSPLNSACYIYGMWKRISDPNEKIAAFLRLQKFVREFPMENRRAFVNCFKATPEVFVNISYEDYTALLDECSRNYPYMVSVIVPVYNSEEYLEETVESILAQTIGFEKIQLILVNNATEDNAGAICERYKEQYPQNVEYVLLTENRGPSGARNAGMPYVRGKYTAFLDSDDKWDPDVLEKQCRFLEKHYSEIDSASCRIRVFDAQNAWHTLDYKFIGDSRVVDILYDYNFTQLSLSSTVVKSSVAVRYSFDETLRAGEDAKYLNEIILRKRKYGLVTNAVFYYRRRQAATSLLQTQWQGESYYFEAPEKFFLHFARLSKELYGEVIPYVQYMLMYDLEWRFKNPLPDRICGERRERYISLLREILENIDDRIILEQQYLNLEQKWHALTVKYGKPQWERIKRIENRFLYKNIELFKTDCDECFFANRISIAEGHLIVEGKSSFLLRPGGYRFAAKTSGGNMYYAAFHQLSAQYQTVSLGEVIFEHRGFTVSIPLTDLGRIDFVMLMDTGEELPVRMSDGEFSKLNRERPEAYYEKDGYFVRISGNGLEIGACSRTDHLRREMKYDWALLRHGRKKAALLRLASFFAKRVCPPKKRIWLFFDRIVTCQDNGEYLFRYVTENGEPDIKPIFVISKNSPEYRRMKRYGKVVPFQSWRYYLLLTVAECFLSSYYDEHIIKPFGKYHRLLSDMCDYKFIYLQHGVIKDNMSKYHNSLNQTIDLFVVSAQREMESMLRAPYGFDRVLRLTGLARYDELNRMRNVHTDKVVLVAPTWRKSLAGGNVDKNSGRHKIISDFQQTDFFKFFNALINDPRLLKCMRDHGYRGEMRLHPAMEQQHEDFTFNDLFSFQQVDTTFAERIADTRLLVTDYSSIAFDYAYANRAVVYTQLWPEEFYQGQTNTPGYFDYRKDGFGPVCNSYDAAVNAIIAYIEKDCAVEDTYQARARDFFAYQDDKNCERIYREILNLDKEA